jgi:hypothetical protein
MSLSDIENITFEPGSNVHKFTILTGDYKIDDSGNDRWTTTRIYKDKQTAFKDALALFLHMEKCGYTVSVEASKLGSRYLVSWIEGPEPVHVFFEVR